MPLSSQLEAALLETEQAPKLTVRDKGSGQYAHSKFDQVCVCGHELGRHSAASVGGQRPCFYGDNDGEEPCECNKFKKARAKR